MKKLIERVDIEVPAPLVWRVLTDFENYPRWNPFIHQIEGDLREGARLTVHLTPPGGTPRTFHPTVVSVRSGEHFAWRGKILFNGLFDGLHEFLLEPRAQSETRLHHMETFSGLLVPLFWKKVISGQTRAGFKAMNGMLKKMLEEY